VAAPGTVWADDTWDADAWADDTWADSQEELVNASNLLTFWLDDATVINPDDATFISGRAHSRSTGAMYVAYWPANDQVVHIDGLAHRYDGALIIAPMGVEFMDLRGISVTSRGEVITTMAGADLGQSGLPLTSGGKLCVQDQT
jgi:hypothetical protein